MKRHFLLLHLILTSVAANAQSITPQVVASAGEHFSSGTSQLSWTLGETVIETVDDGTNIITQGFHQTQLTVTAITEREIDQYINVFPNPTSGELTIQFEENNSQQFIQLYDMNGKLLMEESISGQEQQTILQLNHFANAVYLLNINSKDGKHTSSYRIQKTSN